MNEQKRTGIAATHSTAEALLLCCSQADSIIYQTEKQLKDLGDKVPADVKSKVEAQMESLKQVAGSDDTEATKKAIEDLQKEVRPSTTSHQPLVKAVSCERGGGRPVLGACVCSGARLVHAACDASGPGAVIKRAHMRACVHRL